MTFQELCIYFSTIFVEILDSLLIRIKKLIINFIWVFVGVADAYRYVSFVSLNS